MQRKNILFLVFWIAVEDLKIFTICILTTCLIMTHTSFITILLIFSKLDIFPLTEAAHPVVGYVSI